MHPIRTSCHPMMTKGTPKELEGLQGKLQHTCIGMPASHRLLGPFNTALYTPQQCNKALCLVLNNFGILLCCIITSHPSHCCKLIVHQPGYVSFCDASSLGASSIWFCWSVCLVLCHLAHAMAQWHPPVHHIFPKFIWIHFQF